MDGTQESTAVIGNGGAAAECIKALRENGVRGEIHLFADNAHPVYNPMLSTYYASGKIGFNRLFPYGSGDGFYKEYRVTPHLNAPVTALDAEKRTVTNAQGENVRFDRCLIASGASPVVPPIPGAASGRVLTVRTVEDARRLKMALAPNPRKAIVVGASMVGIKLVEMFYKLGMEVCLADMADSIFPLAAHPDCAGFIQQRLVRKGIKLKLGAGITRIDDSGTALTARFGDTGEKETADLLVMCIGVRANTGFIDKAQIETDRGVIIDDFMETGVKGIYAAGDVAQGRNLLTGEKEIIGLWANARYQGRNAGRNMAGRHEAYPGTLVHNITRFMGMDFVGMGDVRDYDRTEVRTTGRKGKDAYVRLFWKDGTLSGVNLVDRYLEAGVLKHYLAKLKKPVNGKMARPMIQDVLLSHYLS